MTIANQGEFSRQLTDFSGLLTGVSVEGMIICGYSFKKWETSSVGNPYLLFLEGRNYLSENHIQGIDQTLETGPFGWIVLPTLPHQEVPVS